MPADERRPSELDVRTVAQVNKVSEELALLRRAWQEHVVLIDRRFGRQEDDVARVKTAVDGIKAVVEAVKRAVNL